MKSLTLLLLFGFCFTITLCDTKNSTLNDNIQRLFHNVHLPNLYKDQVKLGNKWNFEENWHLFHDQNLAKEFHRLYKNGLLIRKQEIFSINNEKHWLMTNVLTELFQIVKDIDAFYQLACWARNHVNDGLFLYSLTAVILNKYQQSNGVSLPPIYEIAPHYFINSDVMQKAYKVKMLGELAKNVHEQGISFSDHSVIINSSYTGWYRNTDREQTMTYFTEDVGLNAFYYYAQLNPEKFGIESFKYSETTKWFFFHKQLLARYYMERLSNGLSEISKFSWTKPLKSGFISSLTYPNGMHFPSRPNPYIFSTDGNANELRTIEIIERSIWDFLHNSKADGLSPEGGLFYLKLLKLERISKSVLGNSETPFRMSLTAPSVLEHYETSLRDPAFYQLFSYLMQLNEPSLEYIYPTCRRTELEFPGVSITDINIDKLVTFYDSFYVDITNAVRHKSDTTDNRNFYARQQRLSHMPFEITVHIHSEKDIESVLVIYLGPKYDSIKRKIPIEENTDNFMLLDKLDYNLKTGSNKIVIDSFNYDMSDFESTLEVEKESANKYLKHLISDESLFCLPRRLVLPRGTKGGMGLQLVAMVYNKSDAPLGYPFDKKMDESVMHVPNMMFKDVIVTFMSKDDAYRVHKLNRL